MHGSQGRSISLPVYSTCNFYVCINETMREPHSNFNRIFCLLAHPLAGLCEKC